MSWRDVLMPQSAPDSDPQYPHNSQKSVSEQDSGDCGNIGEQKSVVTTLRERVQGAKTWDELSQVLEDSQEAYDAGEITREEVESLEGYIADRGCGTGEHATEDQRLSELLARQHVVRVRSRLLGEVVVWVADGIDVPAGAAEVVYGGSELPLLVGRPPAELRAIHKTKRAFDGVLTKDSRYGQGCNG